MVKFYEGCSDELILFVRHSAWLNAVPDSGDAKHVNTLSRLQRYTHDGIVPKMPDSGPAMHLVDYLWQIGPTLPAGMGDGPITQGEMKAWQDNTGIELTAWEAKTLRRLSIEHLNESHRATDRNCPPPFGTLYRNPKLDKKIDAALD